MYNLHKVERSKKPLLLTDLELFNAKRREDKASLDQVSVNSIMTSSSSVTQDNFSSWLTT